MRKILGEGLFIKYDSNGNPCYIGDKVRLTRPELSFRDYDEHYDEIKRVVPKEVYVGTLILHISKGVVLKTDSGYIYPKFTNKATVKWKWERI